MTDVALWMLPDWTPWVLAGLVVTTLVVAVYHLLRAPATRAVRYLRSVSRWRSRVPGGALRDDRRRR